MEVIRGRYRSYSSSANLGPGFDLMAVALDAFCDEGEVRIRRPGGGVIRVKYVGKYGEAVKGDDVAIFAIREVIRRYSLNIDVDVVINKGVPPGKGLGSSGATAALVVRALNDLLGLNLSIEEEVELAGEGERASAGVPHYDNVAASLAGGLVIVSRDIKGSLRVVKFDIDASFVIAIPDVELPSPKTEVMRSVIPKEIPTHLLVRNTSSLAMLLIGLLTKKYELAGQGMEEYVIVPARSKLVSCFWEAKRAALSAGAYGFTISGAGPSTIALVNDVIASKVAEALENAYTSCGVGVKVVKAKVAPGVTRID